MRVQELANYIIKFDAPMKVWVTEDGSGIVPDVEYDTFSNQLVGLVLPINSDTGMPTPSVFGACTANDIERHLKNSSKSSLVYLIMAQPLKENVPPFVLALFGTDNKFCTQHVIKRWDFIRSELNRFGYFLIFSFKIKHILKFKYKSEQ